MGWKIKFDPAVEKDLKKIDRHTQKLIFSYLKNKVANLQTPKSIGKPLCGNLSGLWRYRVNSYRIICQFQEKALLILVIRISHRKNIYEKIKNLGE